MKGKRGGSFHSPVLMRTEEWVGMVDGLQSGAAERGCRAGLERGIARQAVTAARTDGTCVRSCPYESRDSLSLSFII